MFSDNVLEPRTQIKVQQQFAKRGRVILDIEFAACTQRVPRDVDERFRLSKRNMQVNLHCELTSEISSFDVVSLHFDD